MHKKVSRVQADILAARLVMFVVCILALVLFAIFGTGCAPQRTRPKNMPFPRTLGGLHFPRGTIGLNQQRCFGGGIGGCSMSGKAYEGPSR